MPGFIPPAVGQDIWRLLDRQQAFVAKSGGGTFNFASGAEVGVDSTVITDSPNIRGYIASKFGAHRCVRWAAAIGCVVPGMWPVAQSIAANLDKPLIEMLSLADGGYDAVRAWAVPGEEPTSIRELLWQIGSVCLVGDVARTGASMYRAAQALRNHNAALQVHGVTILQAGRVLTEYSGPGKVVHHTLAQRIVPLGRGDFKAMYPAIDLREVEV